MISELMLLIEFFCTARDYDRVPRTSSIILSRESTVLKPAVVTGRYLRCMYFHELRGTGGFGLQVVAVASQPLTRIS